MDCMGEVPNQNDPDSQCENLMIMTFRWNTNLGSLSLVTGKNDDGSNQQSLRTLGAKRT